MWWCWLAPALAGEITLQDALTRSLGDNLDLAVDRLNLERADARVQSAWAVFDPILSAGAGVSGATSPSNNVLDGADTVNTSAWDYRVGVSQALPSGGRLTVEWAEAWSRSDSAGAQQALFVFDSLALRLSQPLLSGLTNATAGINEARRAEADQELVWRAALEAHVLRVSDAYWALVAAIEYEALADRGAQIAEEQLVDARERFGEGFAGSGDVLQVQRARGEAEAALVSARASREAAHDQLRRVVGVPLESGEHLVPVDRPQVPETLPERTTTLEAATARNTTWLRTRLAVDAAALDLRVATGNALPQLDLSGSVGLAGGAASAADARGQIADATSPRWTVGVDLALPVALRSERAQRTQARIAWEQATIQQRAAEQDLRLQVDAAVRAVERDRTRWLLSQTTLEAATAGLEADRELLRDGRGSTRDVVRSLESLQIAQVAQLDAAINLQRSLMELQRVAGTLLDGVPR